MSHRYWLTVFTPDTWHEFVAHGSDVAGFPETRRRTVGRMKPGDHLVFYVMGLGRLVGIAQITSPAFESDEPIWVGGPYPVRVHVSEVLQIARADRGVPIKELFGELDLFANMENPVSWGTRLRSTPKEVTERDGDAIWAALNKAMTGAASTRHTEAEYLLLKLGAELGYEVYVAPDDRSRVYGDQRLGDMPRIRETLPAQFTREISSIIRRIDVLWLERDAVVAAFEVECTTRIYSGILRMTDLLALQPNFSIRLFLVAPDDRRDEVVRQVNRPTFESKMPELARDLRFLPLEQLRMTMDYYAPMLETMKANPLLNKISEDIARPR